MIEPDQPDSKQSILIASITSVNACLSQRYVLKQYVLKALSFGKGQVNPLCFKIYVSKPI